MILDLLPPELSNELRSGRIEIVTDNAISPKHSCSELVETPVQLTPFGSSWMKIGSCPAKVKDKLKLQRPGTRLTKQQSRWAACINQEARSASFSNHGGCKNTGLSWKCQSESNLSFVRSTTPKMPVCTPSPKKTTHTFSPESMKNATWDILKVPIQPISLLNHLHPSTIPGGLDRRLSIACKAQQLPLDLPESGIKAQNRGNFANVSCPMIGMINAESH